VTTAGADSAWQLASGGCMMPVLLFTLQLSTTRTGCRSRAVTAHAAVPIGHYMGNKRNKRSTRHLFSSVTMGLSTWTLDTKCELHGNTFRLLPCADTRLLIVLLQVTHLPLLPLGTLIYLHLWYKLYQLHLLL